MSQTNLHSWDHWGQSLIDTDRFGTVIHWGMALAGASVLLCSLASLVVS